MNKYFKQVLSLTLIFIFSLIFVTRSVLASTYGYGNYGGGTYNVGQTPGNATPDSPASAQPAPAGCADQSPGEKTPWLYAATAQDGNSILLYFAQAADPVSYYALEFGTESGKYAWGSTNIGGNEARTYLVKSLQPNTTYYFRVRAGNGCATGGWSNEISATTKGSMSYRQLETSSLSLESVAKDDAEIEEEKTEEAMQPAEASYKLNIKVKDDQDKPVAGAKVTIHSKVQETVTDENGVAKFENVEPGDHKVLVTYDGYEGEQNINLTGDNQEFNLNITVTKQSILKSPTVLFIVGGLSLVIVALVVILVKKKK